MRTIFTVLFILVATYALAGEEAIVTADGGVSFSSGYYLGGPAVLDVATDGAATIKFMWFAAASRNSISRVDPAGIFGEASYALRAEFPPRAFQFEGAGPDSCYVDVDTASEVIITW